MAAQDTASHVSRILSDTGVRDGFISNLALKYIIYSQALVITILTLARLGRL